jgi:hypothetical protein
MLHSTGGTGRAGRPADTKLHIEAAAGQKSDLETEGVHNRGLETEAARTKTEVEQMETRIEFEQAHTARLVRLEAESGCRSDVEGHQPVEARSSNVAGLEEEVHTDKAVLAHLVGSFAETLADREPT